MLSPNASSPPEDLETLLEKSSPYQHYDKSQRTTWIRVLTSGFASLCLIIVGTWTGFLVGRHHVSNRQCARMFATWSPAIEVTKFQTAEMVGDFWRPSPYRGTPSKEIDDAWDDLWMVGGVPIRINDADLWKTGKPIDKNWSRIPDELGGGIRGYPQVFHQLHCLNTLRQATHIDYYNNTGVFKDSSHIVRGHLDHCIEILRQQLMCSAEMAPLLTVDVEGLDLPLPDFNSILMCRNFDELRQWTEDHLIHGGGTWEIGKKDV